MRGTHIRKAMHILTTVRTEMANSCRNSATTLVVHKKQWQAVNAIQDNQDSNGKLLALLVLLLVLVLRLLTRITTTTMPRSTAVVTFCRCCYSYCYFCCVATAASFAAAATSTTSAPLWPRQLPNRKTSRCVWHKTL